MQVNISSGHTVLIDEQDLPIFSAQYWHLHNGYVVSTKKQRLHRLIMPVPKGMVTDHINGNKLDNRRENLRVCTQQENSRNRKIAKHNKCGFKGVIWDDGRKKWRAQLRHGGKTINAGRYETKELAAMAYNQRAATLFGIFAKLNILEGQPV